MQPYQRAHDLAHDRILSVWGLSRQLCYYFPAKISKSPPWPQEVEIIGFKLLTSVPGVIFSFSILTQCPPTLSPLSWPFNPMSFPSVLQYAWLLSNSGPLNKPVRSWTHLQNLSLIPSVVSWNVISLDPIFVIISVSYLFYSTYENKWL